VLALVRDIAERKIAKEENRLMQEKIRQMDKMAAIGNLVPGIAHEINNPNNFILSNEQFMSDIWPDINRILMFYAGENDEFYFGKLRFSEAGTLIPKMLGGLVGGANRISAIVTGLQGFARHEKTSLDRQVDVNKGTNFIVTLPVISNGKEGIK
jgi:signal transduction histidine kinase